MSEIGLKQAFFTKQKHCPTQLFVLHHYSEAKTLADPGWRDSRPTLGATLTTDVSGVYNAGRLGTGLGSRVFNHDTNVILYLTSWGDRTPSNRLALSVTKNRA